MLVRLVEAYAAIAGDLPGELVPPASMADLEQILAALPARAETFGFEVRLAGADRRVDLGVAFSLASRGDAFLADPRADAKLARAIEADERWRRLHEFARRWTADSSWRRRAPFLFLELDGDAPRRPVPVPSVFVGLDWPIDELSEEARRPARESDAARTPGFSDALAMISTLRRVPPTTAAEAFLARCFATMPAGGLVLHAAVMLGRPGEGIRLSLYLPRAAAVPYLERLGWEDLPRLERALEIESRAGGSSHPQAPVQIDVDVRDGEAGRGFGVMLQPRSEEAWPALVDVLIREDLCAEERGRALLAWPGTREMGGGGALRRYLAHAKLVVGAGSPARAKAYVGVRS